LYHEELFVRKTKKQIKSTTHIHISTNRSCAYVEDGKV